MRALITGITGQDGSYLTELLLSNGYEVWGLVRRSSSYNRERLKPALASQGLALAILPGESKSHLHLMYGDVTEAGSVREIMEAANPHEVYNLAGQAQVGVSYKCPEWTMQVNAMGAANVLVAAWQHGKRTGLMPKYYQASSSEMFGSTPPPQREDSAFNPVSPYGASKCAAYWTTKVYRRMGMFAVNGILFNHESPRREESFLSRKVTRAVARIKLGLQEKVYLGNLDTSRDWGYSKEYVEAMYLMMQHDRPDDFIICTGINKSVKEWVAEAFNYVGLDWTQYVEINDSYKRPLETPALKGVHARATQDLGWRPRTAFHDLIRMMVASDMDIAEAEIRAMKTVSDGRVGIGV